MRTSLSSFPSRQKNPMAMAMPTALWNLPAWAPLPARLWRSWGPGALVADEETGRYADGSCHRCHYGPDDSSRGRSVACHSARNYGRSRHAAYRG